MTTCVYCKKPVEKAPDGFAGKVNPQAGAHWDCWSNGLAELARKVLPEVKDDPKQTP
jgi:hypothetical protein